MEDTKDRTNRDKGDRVRELESRVIELNSALVVAKEALEQALIDEANCSGTICTHYRSSSLKQRNCFTLWVENVGYKAKSDVSKVIKESQDIGELLELGTFLVREFEKGKVESETMSRFKSELSKFIHFMPRM